MIKNRLFACGYRLFMAAAIIIGLVVGSGISGGPNRMLSYTGQSNMLCAAYAIAAGGAALYACIKKGAKGSASFAPRLACAILMTIVFTVLIFWSVIVPFAGKQKLFSYGNLMLHALSALFMAGDYILFCNKSALKKSDALLFALIPVAYVLETVVLGFSGVVFYVKEGVNYYFPYLFMDFNEAGWLALLSIAVIAAAFIAASRFLIRLSDKPLCKTAYTSETNSGFNNGINNKIDENTCSIKGKLSGKSTAE